MATQEQIRYYRKRHAITRLMDRHAIRITEDEYEELCKQITDQTAEFITRLSKKKTVWYVEVQGQVLSCIYNKRTSGIVTFCNNKWVRGLKKLAQQRIERLSKEDENETISTKIITKTSLASRKTKHQLREIKANNFQEVYV